MPKLIVLFDADDRAASSLAESAATGAREVRFTEVEIRSVGQAGAEKALKAADDLREYDGVLLAYSGETMPAAFLPVLGELTSGGQLPNAVFGLTGVDANALHVIARTGGIIVSEQAGADVNERARKLGARMAKVVGWVRHALGHEAEHHKH
ncbi:MAG: hypothetical protein ABI205_12210 [Gemmatimonadaceae bacterium]